LNDVGFSTDNFVAIPKCDGLTYDLLTMGEPLSESKDRRRSPRFACSGHARIAYLPSAGMLVSGKLRDLSLGGCGIETVSPLACGTRAELLVRVNASSFRAVGEVRATRVPFGIGVEFVQLSAGGQDMLVELIRELGRQQAIARVLRAARRGPDEEVLSRQRAALLLEPLPIVGRVENPEKREVDSPIEARPSLIFDADLDLYI
jgi:hypothetical protein